MKTLRCRHMLSMLLICFLSIHSSLFAQQQVVSGTVFDEAGLEIIGASILELGTQNGTLTDINGRFSFALEKPKAQIEISYLGFVSQKLDFQAGGEYKIILKEENITLDDVVVIGYGVQKKKLVTGATSQVSGDKLMNQSSNGILGAMQSKVSGVTITQTTNQPGGESNVTIRGLGTVGNSSPLYVIDGVAGASMGMLNPSDIESIDILKDAASAAIYGSRAANGVVLITTKKGEKGKMSLSYDGYFGVQSAINSVEMCDAQEYMIMQDERLANATGGEQKGWDWANLLPAELYQRVQDGSWKGTDWYGMMSNNQATMQNHAVSLNGGSDLSRISASYSFSEQEGIFGEPVAPSYSRHNARLTSNNVVMKLNDLNLITLDASMIYSYTTNSGIEVGNRFNNDIQNAMTAPPILPAYDAQGNYYDADDKEADGWLFDKFAFNPLGQMVDKNQDLNKTHRLMANAALGIEPIKNLKFRSAFGYKLFAKSSRNFTAPYNYGENNINGSEIVSQSMFMHYAWTLDNTVNYVFDLNDKHHFDVVLGQSMEKSGLGEQMKGQNTNLNFKHVFDYAWLSNTSGVDPAMTTLSGSPYVENMLASGFGRINYNYNDRYMLTLMMRADGSSVFSEGNRWGYFPSVSGGWIVSDEAFMESTKAFLDYFKIRASWGQNGNCNINPFQYLATVAYPKSDSYYFGDGKDNPTAGAYPNVLPNPDITWETSEQIDLGFDANFFNSRLVLNFDWYQKRTKDWLVRAPMLGSYGTNAPFINGGDVLNEGVEVALSYNDRVGSFTYGANVNVSYNHNEVTSIANSEGIIYGPKEVLDQGHQYLYMAEVGKPIGYFYGYKTEGIFQNEEQVANTVAKLPNSAPGDVIFSDLNGDGKITADDMTEIGNPHPDVILGLGINLGYKAFDFNIAANGAFGQQVAQSYRPQTNKIYYNYTQKMFDERWHGEGTSNTFPRLGNSNNFNAVSDLYIQDADYLRIQNITLGCDFKKLFPKLPFERLRLYGTLQNFFTITGYDGLDPAVGYGGGDSWSSGVDLGYYPAAKSVIFGLNLTL